MKGISVAPGFSVPSLPFPSDGRSNHCIGKSNTKQVTVGLREESQQLWGIKQKFGALNAAKKLLHLQREPSVVICLLDDVKGMFVYSKVTKHVLKNPGDFIFLVK
jgi:hypothetical protein